MADAHVKALEVLPKYESSIMTCNLGTGKGSSVLEVIHTFEHVNGISIPFELAERRAGDVTEAWADPWLAEEKMGWKAKYSLSEMLNDAWNWQKKNPFGFDSKSD